MDYYSILEIDRVASTDDIKKAYRKLAMKYHPDRTQGDKDMENKFKKINEAYSVLSDSNKRQQYDTFGSVNGNDGFGFNDGVNISDIFNSFFSSDFSSQSFRKRKNQSMRGEDLEYILSIDLKTSIYGGEKKINYNRMEACLSCNSKGGSGKKTCDTCFGSGSVTHTQNSVFGVIKQTQTCDVCSGSGEIFENTCSSCSGQKRTSKEANIDIQIPAGIDDGMIIKISGEGNSPFGDSNYGDLYLKFVVNLEEKGLKRDGNNLYYDLEIDILEAVLGTKKEINIPVLGKRKISIKPGTDFASILKTSSDGVKDLNSDTKGDLFISIAIKIPKKLSKTEKTLYLNLAKEKKINVNDDKMFWSI